MKGLKCEVYIYSMNTNFIFIISRYTIYSCPVKYVHNT